MKRIGTLVCLTFLVVVQLLANPGKKELKIGFRDVTTGLFDVTSIYLDIGRGPLFNPANPPLAQPEDEAKPFDTAVAKPQVYSFTTDSIACYSNSYGAFGSTTIVRLGVRVQGGHSYTFSAQMIDNFDPTTIILIEDRSTGTFQSLRQRGEFTVSLPQPESMEYRFYVHITYPPVIDPIPSGCDNNDGMVTVTQDTFIKWDLCSIDRNGSNPISSYTGISGDLSFSNLPAGTYNVNFYYQGYPARKIVVVGTYKITSSAAPVDSYAAVNEILSFYSQAQNATSYVWDFGEGTVITGVANPEMAYALPGVYSISLHCSNTFGCNAYEYLTAHIGLGASIGDDAEIIPTITLANRTLIIQMNDQVSGPVNYQVYNIAGQEIISGTASNVHTPINLSSQTSGIYILRLQGDDHGTYAKKFFLE
ncbi:MAG: T9SS type A sorting domain-containing protein [Bacteroidetes bacterium]|nr:T9SS type A sorting domain-containing protein [Bacteroidota bacterium]